jgi:cytoskeletal protein CcmA (bactofilin family)
MSPPGDEDERRVSLLGPNSELKGEFATEDELVILGRLTGKRVQAPVITIGPSACVKADIDTQSIRIEGVVIGDIRAAVSIIVQASATIRGTIYCPSITIRDGASVNGSANLDVAKDDVTCGTGRRPRRVAAARRL